MVKYSLSLVAIATAIAAFGQAAPNTGKLTVKQWREDLAVYREQMPEVHANLFHVMTRAQFNHSLDALEAKLPTLSQDQVKVEILRMVAMINDGHTRVRPQTLGNRMLPVRLRFFADGLFVESADQPFANLVGGKVLRIGDVSAEDAYQAVRPLLSIDGDNEFRRRLMAPGLLVTPEILQALGIAKSADAVEITVEKSGRAIKANLPAGPSRVWNNHGQTPDSGGWVTAHDSSPNPLPLYLQHTDRNYWDTMLPDGKTLYLQYNEVQDQPGGEPIATYFPRVFAEAAEKHVERIVLDLRWNGGGNNYLNRPIWHAIIRNDSLNRRGKLWVITGPQTFSAAMNCVDDFELNTNALFAGEPTGETPNMFGDPAPVTLPNSGIVIGASTLWWQSEDPRDKRNFRGPDLAAEMTSTDFANNLDPVMTAIETAGDLEPLPNQLRRLADAGKLDAIASTAKAYFADPRFRWVDVESAVNDLGYELVGQGKLKAAVEVLKVNAARYPQSWNAWDSLAEAEMKSGDREDAIRDYRRSLELNPKNTGAREAIAKAEAR